MHAGMPGELKLMASCLYISDEAVKHVNLNWCLVVYHCCVAFAGERPRSFGRRHLRLDNRWRSGVAEWRGIRQLLRTADRTAPCRRPRSAAHEWIRSASAASLDDCTRWHQELSAVHFTFEGKHRGTAFATFSDHWLLVHCTGDNSFCLLVLML